MMKHAIGVSAALLSLLWLGACAKPTPQQETKKPMVSGKLTAKTYNSGFALAHDTYNGMLAASDGKIYYVLSAEPQDVAGQMFVYDPATDKTKFVGDLTEACGEKGRVYVSEAAAGENIVFAVEDDGCGIAPEDYDLLFEVGYSTKFCPDTGKMSTGLGLAHVRNLSEMMGGTVTIDSAPGKYTRFTVTLPAANIVGTGD